MMTPSLDQRLKDLANHVTQDLQLLNEYEVALRYEDEPRRKARYQHEIEQLRESARRYQAEYDQLNQQVTAEMRTVAEQLQQMDHKLNWMLSSHATIDQNLDEMRQIVLTHYTATEQQLLSSITHQLDQQQLALTQVLIEALDTHQLPEADIEEMWAIVQTQLPTLPASQAQNVAEIIKNPALDTKHKLKVSLPIVPLLVNYEGEFELGSGFNLKAAWEALKAKLRKQPVATSQPHKPIWEFAQDLIQDVPEEELRRLPKDGAVNHDHYIYGTAKVEP
jgi:uncharacterized protein with HEPN domain